MNPLTAITGPCIIEDEDICLEIATVVTGCRGIVLQYGAN